jgi:hypothetical protein
LLLSISSIILFIFTLKQKKDRKLIPFFLFLTGAVYFFEYVVLVLLNSYVYYPEVLKNNYYDSILGSIPSNALSVPAAGLFIVVFQLRFLWTVGMAAIFMGIKSLFLMLDIYEHNWWRTYFTGIGLLFYFWLAKKFHIILQATNSGSIRFLMMYTVCVPLPTTTSFFLITVFEKLTYTVGWFDNGARDSIAFQAAYNMFFLSIFLTIAVLICFRWYNLFLVVVLPMIAEWLLVQD